MTKKLPDFNFPRMAEGQSQLIFGTLIVSDDLSIFADPDIINVGIVAYHLCLGNTIPHNFPQSEIFYIVMKDHEWMIGDEINQRFEKSDTPLAGDIFKKIEPFLKKDKDFS